MGDYNVQIVSAGIKTDRSAENFEKEVRKRLPQVDSAYHATAPFIRVSESWSKRLTISLIVQAKWNNGVDEFLDWMEPMVVQGMGEDDVWSINFSEYSGEPTFRRKLEEETDGTS